MINYIIQITNDDGKTWVNFKDFGENIEECEDYFINNADKNFRMISLYTNITVRCTFEEVEHLKFIKNLWNNLDWKEDSKSTDETILKIILES